MLRAYGSLPRNVFEFSFVGLFLGIVNDEGFSHRLSSSRSGFSKTLELLGTGCFCGFIRLCIMVDLLHLPLGYFFLFRAAHGLRLLLLFVVCLRTKTTSNCENA